MDLALLVLEELYECDVWRYPAVFAGMPLYPTRYLRTLELLTQHGDYPDYLSEGLSMKFLWSRDYTRCLVACHNTNAAA